KLRPRGSNPDFLVQSEACCHYTRPQWLSSGYRREIGGGVFELRDRPGDVDAVGQHPPRLGQVLGALDAEAAGDAPALQVPDRELAAVAVAAPDLLLPIVGRSDVLEARPIGEVAEEVGNHFVVGVGAEHVGTGVLALLHRHVPVLDVDPPPVDDALVRATVAGRVDALGRGPQLRVADDPAVADLDPGPLRQHRVGTYPRPDDNRVAL